MREYVPAYYRDSVSIIICPHLTELQCDVIIIIDNCSFKGAARILKIILWILIALVILLLLVLLSNVKILAGYSESFYWKLSVAGIPINPAWFIKKDKKEKAKASHKAKRKKPQKKRQTQPEKASEKKKSSTEGLSLILELAKKAAQTLPRVFRIRIKKLRVTVGGSDAADIATDYGKIYAITEGALAALDAYSGMFYGFRANRRKISVNCNFLAPKTKVTAELTVSFFVWQLLFAAVRIGAVYVVRMMQRGEVDNIVKKEI